MDRKSFIKIAGLGSIPLFFNGCSSIQTNNEYSIQLESNRKLGHLSREELAKKPKFKCKFNTVIIGAGIAGVSSYAKLNDDATALIDLNSFIGGTAGGGNFKSSRYARGAHYDIIYPNNYGAETLQFLSEANIIDQNEFTKQYHFKDEEFLISTKNESTCLRFSERVRDPLADLPELDGFIQLLSEFKSEMVMPTVNIKPKYDYLDKISFKNWLKDKIELSDIFSAALDYQMRDDWGGDCSEVSALAGIHYYMCRNYSEELELISPPEGNQYFAEKLLATTEYKNILLNHLCHSIEHLSPTQFKVIVYDSEADIVKEITCNNIIYAGNKHALKHIFPKASRNELIPEYSAWVSINLIMDKFKNRNGFWQNDVITKDKSFLGFSDSRAQFDYINDFDVLTAYYCFNSRNREALIGIESNPKSIVEKTIDYIEHSLEEDIRTKLKKVNVNLMGHAMPLPKPGYLKQDWNKNRPLSNFTYAGVDTGKLPLFFEAVDSGLKAAEELNNAKMPS